jgi:glutaconate CoA-transferase subunit B
MVEYAKDYAIDELMVVALAREMKDGEMMYLGAAIPLGVVATQLARATHAPNLVCIYGIWVDPDPFTDYFSVLVDPLALKAFKASAFTAMGDLHDLWQRGEIDFGLVRPAQIDQYGNINNSAIGEYSKPKVRFPGGVAIGDVTHLVGRLLAYVPRHEPRVFVEKVDFITGPGNLENGTWRKKMGIKGKGTHKVITDLAVLGFDEKNGRMRLESLHPGISLDEIKKNTGFDLIIPQKVPETEPPTVEQLRLVREKIDPSDARKLDYRPRR